MQENSFGFFDTRLLCDKTNALVFRVDLLFHFTTFLVPEQYSLNCCVKQERFLQAGRNGEFATKALTRIRNIRAFSNKTSITEDHRINFKFWKFDSTTFGV